MGSGSAKHPSRTLDVTWALRLVRQWHDILVGRQHVRNTDEFPGFNQKPADESPTHEARETKIARPVTPAPVHVCTCLTHLGGRFHLSRTGSTRKMLRKMLRLSNWESLIRARHPPQATAGAQASRLTGKIFGQHLRRVAPLLRRALSAGNAG